MCISGEASPASEAPQSSRTGFAVSAGAVVRNCTSPCPLSSTVKKTIVTVLAAMYEHSPVLAAALAHVVGWCWRRYRGQ
jgi:hypothetical protein